MTTEISNLEELTIEELMSYDGGILPLLGGVFGILGVGLAAAYGVGYAVGSLR